jgi:hypothetical protein
MKNLQKIFLAIAILISYNHCIAAQVEWTEANCRKVTEVSLPSATHLNNTVGTWKVKYTTSKILQTIVPPRLGCFIHLETPNAPYICTTSGLYSDGKKVWGHVENCAPAAHFN